MNITKVTSKYPPTLTKTFWLDKDGTVRKETVGSLSRGTYETMSAETPAELKRIVDPLGVNQSLMYGIPLAGDSTSGTIASAAQAKGGDITRTRSNFAFSCGTSVMMLDYDAPKDGGAPMTFDDIYEGLEKVVPGFRERVPHLLAHSASSYVYNAETGEEIRGDAGKRVYVFVKDGSDIPRAGKALAGWLKLAGGLRVEISRAGCFLERGPVDDSVFQPERLDFCAGALCRPPLVQRRPGSVPVNNDGEPLDTMTALKDLTQVQKAQIGVMLNELKPGKAEEARRVREAYIERHVAKLPKDADRDAYRKTLENGADMGVLGPDFPVVVDDAVDGRKTVTVADILGNPARYDGTHCPDPVEPEYDGGRAVAKIYLNGASPTIHSFAHGGRTYRLANKRQVVECPQGQTEETADKVLAILAGNKTIYRSGGSLVEPDGEELAHIGQGALLRSHLDRQIRFATKTKKGIAFIDCPGELASRVYVKKLQWMFHPVRKVVRYPVMRLDGSIVSNYGYDPATKLIYEVNPDDDARRTVPAYPSATDTENALFRLWEPFRMFPFDSDESRGGVMAAILTTAVRASLKSAPGFVINAPAYGSGKTLLAKTLAAMAGGHSSTISWADTEQEREKKLGAILAKSPGSIILDNVEGSISSPSLASILTTDVFETRRLGESEMIECATNTMLFVTGNNTYPIADLSRRFCVVRIDPMQERPEKREFPFSPISLVEADVGRFRCDALTVLRAFAAEGFPKVEMSSTGSFEDWDRIVRQCVCWLVKKGIAPAPMCDPVVSSDYATELDPVKAKLAALLEAWRDVFGPKPTTSSDLAKAATAARLGAIASPGGDVSGEAAERLKEAVEEICATGVNSGTLNTRILGNFLVKHKGKVVNGVMLHQERTKRNNKVQFSAITVG